MSERASEQDRLYHQQLLLPGDMLAKAEVCELYFPLLQQALDQAARGNQELRDTAASMALMDLCHHPERYDPEQRSLFAYLRMAAHGDLKNLQRSERRHQNKTISLTFVAEGQDAGNLVGREKPPDKTLIAQEDRKQLDAFAATLDETDRTVFALMRAGERKTAAYVPVLGLHDRTLADQRREVKRNKDRLMRRWERWGKQP